jgi:L-threonylcarbamoyladenylate synthase
MVVPEKIDKAVAVLRRGGLVAFPTETVYGLGADATNAEALQKIFAAKQRPVDHPLIVHLADAKQLSAWARDISPTAQKLAEAFWPGPLTLIFKKTPDVLDMITGGQDTVGLRVPAHPVAHALLEAFGKGVAAPSANRFGRISPTTALAVDEELEETVDYILDGGQCAVGVESTIVDVSGEHPVILRPGMITAQQIEAVLETPVLTNQKETPRVSGSMESHYAPDTLLQLLESDEVKTFVEEVTLMDLPLAIVTYSHQPVKCVGVEWVVMSQDVKQYAHDLYGVLRELDKKQFKRLMIEKVPAGDQWEAVRDRLQRASQR